MSSSSGSLVRRRSSSCPATATTAPPTHQPRKHQKASASSSSSSAQTRKPRRRAAGTSSCSNEGSFVAVMTTNNNNMSQLHLPIEFWKPGGLEEKKWVMLEDPNGRKWFVNIRTIFDSRIGRVSQLDFGYGWSQFRNDNGLVDGDECEFSLVQEDPNKIKVIARPSGVFFVSEEEE